MVKISKIKPNLWFGVKNQYTLSNEFIWKKANILCGKIFIGISLILLIPNLFINPSEEYFFIYYLLVVTLIGLIISYVVTYKYSKKLSKTSC